MTEPAAVSPELVEFEGRNEIGPRGGAGEIEGARGGVAAEDDEDGARRERGSRGRPVELGGAVLAEGVGEREVEGEAAGEREGATKIWRGTGDEGVERGERGDESGDVVVGEGDAGERRGGKLFPEGAQGGGEVAGETVVEGAVDDEVKVGRAFDGGQAEAIEARGDHFGTLVVDELGLRERAEVGEQGGGVAKLGQGIGGERAGEEEINFDGGGGAGVDGEDAEFEFVGGAVVEETGVAALAVADHRVDPEGGFLFKNAPGHGGAVDVEAEAVDENSGGERERF
jgi:hypothetical protein